MIRGNNYQETDYLDEWSDSDNDDSNMNSNSRQLRKRHYDQTLTRPSEVPRRSSNVPHTRSSNVPLGPSNVSHTSRSSNAPHTSRSSNAPHTRSSNVLHESSPLSFNLDDEKKPKRRTPLKESHIKYPVYRKLTTTHSPRYQTISSENNLDKPDFIICDSDTENDVNDTCNYSVYEYLKAFLNSTGRQIDAIRGDGNCFFRVLSKVIYGNQSFYNEIRQGVVDVLEQYPKKFEAFADGPMPEHIRYMREDKTWATQTEIYAAATLLNRDIYILSPDQTGQTYRWLLFKPQFKYNSSVTGCKCYITICHTHGNHYDRIAPLKSTQCNCGLEPPAMSGINESVDLTSEDEIV